MDAFQFRQIFTGIYAIGHSRHSRHLFVVRFEERGWLGIAPTLIRIGQCPMMPDKTLLLPTVLGNAQIVVSKKFEKRKFRVHPSKF